MKASATGAMRAPESLEAKHCLSPEAHFLLTPAPPDAEGPALEIRLLPLQR